MFSFGLIFNFFSFYLNAIGFKFFFFQGSLLIRVHKEMRLYSVNC